MSKATIPSYKWWETDDKTKRLYTELLAEKLSSPRKSSGSLTRKPSNSSIKKSPANDTTGLKSKDGASVGAPNVEKAEHLEKKYTFETITIDTLAKYDYIKSPTKKAATDSNGLPDAKQKTELQADLLSKSPATQTKTAYSGTNGHFLLSKNLSVPAKMEASPCESKAEIRNKTTPAKLKEKTPEAKLLEVPEYGFSHNSAKSEVMVKSNEEAENIASLWNKKVLSSDDKSHGLACRETVDIKELTQKYQMLCNQVEQIEMKLSEFSDDVQKITVGMGFKDAKDKASKDLKSGKDVMSPRKPAFTSFKDKYGLGAAMDPQTSPSKPFRSLLYKSLTIPAAKSKEELDAEIKKIKQGQLTEDEIQEILRCAKAKYIDNPNYLNELGYEFKPKVRLND